MIDLRLATVLGLAKVERMLIPTLLEAGWSKIAAYTFAPRAFLDIILGSTPHSSIIAQITVVKGWTKPTPYGPFNNYTVRVGKSWLRWAIDHDLRMSDEIKTAQRIKLRDLFRVAASVWVTDRTIEIIGDVVITVNYRKHKLPVVYPSNRDSDSIFLVKALACASGVDGVRGFLEPARTGVPKWPYRIAWTPTLPVAKISLSEAVEVIREQSTLRLLGGGVQV